MVNKIVEIGQLLLLSTMKSREMIGSKSMYTQPSNIKLNMSSSFEMFIEYDLLSL